MDILRVNIVLGFCLLVVFVEGSHFRGGTISWTPTGNGNEVEFKFRLAWTYGCGPGCTTAAIGQLVTRMSSSYWMCNICTPWNIENVNYICTGASTTEDWEQGERTFRHTFSGVGPYTISFTGGNWMSLNYGSPGYWIVQTTVDLRNRSDTGRPNISPITASIPVYKLQSRCKHALKIPMIDPDGDNLRCRWSTPAEAGSISRLLPNALIDEQTCTIHLTTTASHNYVPGGWYAVAITIEDYPKRDIMVDGIKYTHHSTLSTVPLQFLINTPELDRSCSDQPVFVTNTPAEDAVIQIRTHQTLGIRFYASSRYSISNIVMTSPAGLTSSSLKIDDMGRTHVRYTDITWTPSQSQKGSHILCGLAIDSQGKTSYPRCITLLVWDCRPGPTDVIFLVDTSHSETNVFNQSINYIKRFVEKVPVGQKDFAFSIISYSFEPRLEFDFDDHVNKSSLLSSISTIVPVSGATYTAKALEKAFEVLVKSSYGVRATGSQKFVVLLSDGLSTDRNKINEARMKLNSFNIRTMAVGIGEQVDHKELLQIATSPAYVFSPESNDAFNRVMLESVGDDCRVCPHSSSTDVFIFFDTSYDHHEQFHEALDVLASLITTLNIESMDINVGLASFDEDIDILISLNENATTDKLQTEMQTIKTSRQPSDVNNLLNYARETSFKEMNGARENARKVIILFSNGHWENKPHIKEEIIFCQRQNITVVLIATSIDADLETMFEVASTQHNVIYVDSIQNKNNLKSIISYINYLECQDDLFT